MKLSELIGDMGTINCVGSESPSNSVCDPEIRAITYRAQEVRPGDLFVAIKGFNADGHDFIDTAVQQGAAAIVCQGAAPSDAVSVTVENSRKALASLSAVYHANPSHELMVIGITGTNGKTTTTYLIESILQTAGLSVGVIGTINYRYGDKAYPNPVTTPESLDLQRILADMREAGVTHVVMEVSSHALDLFRVHQCHFDLAVFTNFTQDHLDYHKTMENYWDSKRKLFLELLPVSDGKTEYRAVLNVAVAKGRDLAKEIGLPFLSCGEGMGNDLNALQTQFDLNGTRARISTPLGEMDIQSSLVGRHNMENILNAVGVAIALDIAPNTIVEGISTLKNVPGRLEDVPNEYQRYVYVDYAHTPDALESSLWALRALTADRIICVFGCGGDRDRAKRPKMGAIAGRLSDLVVVTSDNPRTESPDQIITQIVGGLGSECCLEYSPDDLIHGFEEKGYVVIADRRDAIGTAIAISRPNDTILIAGKGHEPYQVVGDQKLPLDDRQEAHAALAGVR